MKFGQVTHPQDINFSIPINHPDTDILLSKYKSNEPMNVHVGCAKWNRQDLKNFYPKGTKDDLAYYSTQFNSFELNATFYPKFPPETYVQWYNRTPVNFKFFPKIIQNVSHFRRLNEQAYPVLDEYLNMTSNLQKKLGTIFLQMHSNFSPKDWDRVVRFIELWPKEFQLAIEFRHTDWINDKLVAQELYHLLEENGVANVLVDTA